MATKVHIDTRPLGGTKSWAGTIGTHLAGQAHIDGVDETARRMEDLWGVGRLRLLVSAEMREKFDRQAFKLNAAIWHGDLAELQRECGRMITAWTMLSNLAMAEGHKHISPVVWEVALEDGTVAAIVRSQAEASAVIREGRAVTTYTLDELAHMLSLYQSVTRVKEAFPGAMVTKIRRDIQDPLNGIHTGTSLEDTMDDPIPDLGT